MKRIGVSLLQHIEGVQLIDQCFWKGDEMRLQGKKVAVLVAEGLEDLEYYVPMMRLQEEGAQVLTAALEIKPIHGKNGLEITPDTRHENRLVERR